MSLTAAVRGGRAAAARLMTDTCTIRRGAGEPTFDAVTDRYDPAPGELLYAGPCRVKPRDNADRVVEAAGEQVSLFPYVVSVPVSDIQFEVDDLVTVAGSVYDAAVFDLNVYDGQVLDPAIPGLELRVKQISLGSQLTARRLGCEVQSG